MIAGVHNFGGVLFSGLLKGKPRGPNTQPSFQGRGHRGRDAVGSPRQESQKAAEVLMAKVLAGPKECSERAGPFEAGCRFPDSHPAQHWFLVGLLEGFPFCALKAKLFAANLGQPSFGWVKETKGIHAVGVPQFEKEQFTFTPKGSC